MNRLKITKNKEMCVKLLKIIIFSVYLISFSCVNKKPKPETEIEHSIHCEYSKYENGNIHRLGMEIDSIPTGLWINFFPDGKIQYFTFYLNGKDCGPVVGFYKNGRIRSYWFANKKGQIHGESKSFYDNGQTCVESFYINDSIHGLLKLYDRNGNIEAIWEYDMDKFIRTIYGYDPDSEKAEEEYLKNIIEDDGEE